jgi:hypothetical protein
VIISIEMVKNAITLQRYPLKRRAQRVTAEKP